MWRESYSKVFHDVKPESIWRVWIDINNWHVWNPGIEFCQFEKPFAVGNYFTLKPVGAPAVKIQLVEVLENHKFTDCTSLFGAKMYGEHELSVENEGIRLTTTMIITGRLGFLWRKFLGEKIAAKVPEQTEALVALARKNVK